MAPDLLRSTLITQKTMQAHFEKFQGKLLLAQNSMPRQLINQVEGISLTLKKLCLLCMHEQEAPRCSSPPKQRNKEGERVAARKQRIQISAHTERKFLSVLRRKFLRQLKWIQNSQPCNKPRKFQDVSGRISFKKKS